jgi:hypothetical protein
MIECEPNSIPLLATLKFLETMHHVELFALILGLVQLKSIKQLQAHIIGRNKQSTHQLGNQHHRNVHMSRQSL